MLVFPSSRRHKNCVFCQFLDDLPPPNPAYITSLRISWACDSKLEDELIKQVEHTLKQLEARGEPIVLQHVCDLVGLTYSWMVKKYPRIRALFHEYQKNRSERCLSPRVD